MVWNRAFSTTEEGMQYCEEQFLAVAAQHGLCRPPSSVLTLEGILSLHGNVVSIRSAFTLSGMRQFLFACMQCLGAENCGAVMKSSCTALKIGRNPHCQYIALLKDVKFCVMCFVSAVLGLTS